MNKNCIKGTTIGGGQLFKIKRDNIVCLNKKELVYKAPEV